MVKELYFPDDGREICHISSIQKNAIQALNDSIHNGTLKLVKNNCLCGNPHPEQDVLISGKDRFGISCPIVICSRCGLVRSASVFDTISNTLFYQKYYRDIYTTKEKIGTYFEMQVKRGLGFMELIDKNNLSSNISVVAEIGCGAGGILFPFYQRGKNVSGYDLDEDFINYGKSQGINIVLGDFYQEVPDNSLDLAIASHVVEHFLSPIEELQKIISKIKIGKYLLIEVPGLFYQSDGPMNPILLFQNAHVFQYFYKDYLTILFQKLGLQIIYGDERCTFICKKTDYPPQSDSVFDDTLKGANFKAQSFLSKCYKNYQNRWHKSWWIESKTPRIVKFCLHKLHLIKQH